MTSNNTAIQARSNTLLSHGSKSLEYAPSLNTAPRVLDRGVRISGRTALRCTNTERDSMGRGPRISTDDRGVRISGHSGVRISARQGVRISGQQGVRNSGCEQVRIGV